MLEEACSPPPSMVNSLLLEAAKQGKTITIKTMLANGANINTKDKYGFTALMYAVSNGYVEIVKVLLSKGANTEEKNSDGKTALMMAKHPEIIELMR